MKIKRYSLFTLSIAFFSALMISNAIAGPVDDGSTLTCSNDTSKANINDIRFAGTGLGSGEKTYLEVYIIEPNVDISNWELCYTYPGNKYSCTELGVGNFNEWFYGNAQGDDASPDKFNTGTYLELALPSTLSPTEGEVLLVNRNTDTGTDIVIDYLQYCDTSPCPTPRWVTPITTIIDASAGTSTPTGTNGCGTIVTNHSADNKDLARLPDATGDFGDNGDDVTRGDTNDDSLPAPLFGFTFDEPFWNGTAGEIIDTQAQASGKAIGDANTLAALGNSAILGNPGTCGYGTFDGDGDYVEAGAAPAGGKIELKSPSLTFSTWIQTKDNSTAQTIFSFGNGLNLSLTPTGKLTFGSNQLSPDTLSTADGVITNDTWYFISLVIDPANNDILLYTATQAGGITLVASHLDFSLSGSEFAIEIENSGDLTIGGGSGLSSFNGFIDEPALFGGPLNTAKLATIKAKSRPCTVTGITHYEITHNGPGITCAPTTVTITGHDSGDNPTAPVAGTTITVSINNNTANLGSWSGTGVTPITNNSAQYTFDGAQTSVDLQLLYPQVTAPDININVNDGTYSESEDPDLIIGSAKLLFSNVPTQISGKPSDTGFNAQTITMQAVRASNNNAAVCVPGFPNNTTRNIDFGAECRNPTGCAGLQMSVTNNGTTTPIATNTDNTAAGTSTYTPDVPILFTNNATANIVINYPDAGLMQLHAKYNTGSNTPSGTEISNGTTGSTNDFVVRPFAFRFSNINKAGTANPGGTASTGSGFVAAEDTFAATISALQWQTDEDSNADGVPEITDILTDNPVTKNFNVNTPITVSSTAAFSPATMWTTGALAGTTAIDFTTNLDDTITVSNLTYNEVGSMSLSAEVLDYLGATDADISGTSEEIGRFYPDHFTLAPGNTITPSCSATFTYMDEPALSIQYTLEARGLNEHVTTNYDKTIKGYSTGTIALVAENANSGSNLASRLGNASSDWVSGSYAISTAAASFARGATGPDGPYSSLQLGLSMVPTTEQDTRDIQALDMNATTSDDCSTSAAPCNAKSFGATDVRFGRLSLTNAFGSELLGLNVPVTVEYYNGSSFILNADDSCTTRTDLPAAAPTWGDITLPTASYTGNLVEGETTPSITGMMSAGVDAITLTAPGAGNDGSVTVDLSAPIWLQFDWDGNGTYTDDPSATATFGIFRGNDATIYRRELY